MSKNNLQEGEDWMFVYTFSNMIEYFSPLCENRTLCYKVSDPEPEDPYFTYTGWDGNTYRADIERANITSTIYLEDPPKTEDELEDKYKHYMFVKMMH